MTANTQTALRIGPRPIFFAVRRNGLTAIAAGLIAALLSACMDPRQTEGQPVASNPVLYFEIPVNDLDRAVAFYERVFRVVLKRTDIDGNAMVLFPHDENGRGISGALAKGESYVPGAQGTRIYFATANIEDTLAKVTAAGGRVVYPKTSIGSLGWVAEFEDSEGNVIALHTR